MFRLKNQEQMITNLQVYSFKMLNGSLRIAKEVTLDTYLNEDVKQVE